MWWLVGSALAQSVITGGDYLGADLRPADGDTLEGVFTNVGQFVVEPGTTVYVQREVQLEVYADTIRIDGVLEGTGAGLPGGSGGPIGAFDGASGTGPGRGQGGLAGPCVHGGGGGGGAYGGPGGDGSYYFAGQGQGGLVNGDEFDPVLAVPGSGGGGGGSGCDLAAGDGGNGGASLFLVGGIVTIDGMVRADGGRGQEGPQWSGAGGGGSGGSIFIDGAVVEGVGEVTAKGGPGGDTTQGVGGLAGGGGGGGGGRIYIYYGVLSPSLVTGAPGGQRGLDQAVGYTSPGQNGQPGTVYTLLTDPDVDDDGINVPDDNCPNDPNPDQADGDGDGIGDACDVCPDDPVDSDGDGVCDSVDICLGHNDNLDEDGDGQPDGCDCEPEDPLAGTGWAEVCDGVDNDCNGLTDDPGAEGERDFFIDLDGDGFGDPEQIRRACEPPLNYVEETDDCDDTRPAAFPGGEEICDGLDNDCDGKIDPGCPKPESEGVLSCDSSSSGAAGAGLLLGALAVLSRRRRQ
jgi:hypothetical protein